jgi:multidrug resistance efflux pump
VISYGSATSGGANMQGVPVPTEPVRWGVSSAAIAAAETRAAEAVPRYQRPQYTLTGIEQRNWAPTPPPVPMSPVPGRPSTKKTAKKTRASVPDPAEQLQQLEEQQAETQQQIQDLTRQLEEATATAIAAGDLADQHAATASAAHQRVNRLEEVARAGSQRLEQARMDLETAHFQLEQARARIAALETAPPCRVCGVPVAAEYVVRTGEDWHRNCTARVAVREVAA